MTPVTDAIDALEEMGRGCTRLAGVLRDIQAGTVGIDSPVVQLAAAAYSRAAATASIVFLKWVQEMSANLQRSAAAGEN